MIDTRTSAKPPGPPPAKGMSWIPGGSFLMGSDLGQYPEENPPHTVTVDGSGTAVRQAGSSSDIMLISLVGGTATAGAVAATGAGFLVLMRRRIDGRTLAALEREWEQVEPVWSGRLRRESGPENGPGTDDV